MGKKKTPAVMKKKQWISAVIKQENHFLIFDGWIALKVGKLNYTSFFFEM